MASCITSEWAAGAPQARLTVTQTSQTDTSATLSWTLEYIARYAAQTSVSKEYTVKINGSTVKTGTVTIGGFVGTKTVASGTTTIGKGTSANSVSFGIDFTMGLNWGGVYRNVVSASGTISVSAKTSYTVSYNANGGTGAPSSQTKWYGTNLTLSNVAPTRTGYTFLGWGTSSTTTTVTYAKGSTYSSNSAAILYAVWARITYTIKFNANGGMGAPGNQTKNHGQTLTLPSTTPTRAYYTFLGWSTSSTATRVQYPAGGNYTADAGATLYAVWELAYTDPYISNLSVQRCASNGTASETGAYASLSFKWGCFSTVTISNIKIYYSNGLSNTLAKTISSPSGTSGNVSAVVGGGNLSADNTYTIQVLITDSTGKTVSSTAVLSGAVFPIDILASGTGIAFGKSADLANFADFGWGANFRGPVYGNTIGLSALPSIPANADLNNYRATGCWAVTSNTTAGTISNMPINQAGRLIVSGAIGGAIDPNNTTGYRYIRQQFIPFNPEDPTYERLINTQNDGAFHYNNWVATTLKNPSKLWEGAYTMSESQQINLPQYQYVSYQRFGIILTFSPIVSGQAQDNKYQHFFVPKMFVSTKNGYGSGFTMNNNNFSVVSHKYLYIFDNHISGSSDNTLSGTGTSGIKYNNSSYVLRYVWGI